MTGALRMWTIFWNPRDAPGLFVLRLFEIHGGSVSPTTEASKHKTLEAARAAVPPGLYCLPRDPDDEPQIVESWF